MFLYSPSPPPPLVASYKSAVQFIQNHDKSQQFQTTAVKSQQCIAFTQHNFIIKTVFLHHIPECSNKKGKVNESWIPIMVDQPVIARRCWFRFDQFWVYRFKMHAVWWLKSVIQSYRSGNMPSLTGWREAFCHCLSFTFFQQPTAWEASYRQDINTSRYDKTVEIR